MDGKKNLPLNKKEWETKLWCAKEFGWKPYEVDRMSFKDIDNLITVWNQEQRKLARQQRIAHRKMRKK